VVRGVRQEFTNFLLINSIKEDNPLYLLKPDMNKTPVLGRLNGTIKIPDDFDEPLEEMKEYMY